MILDCDPGTDDAIAIAVLAGRADAHLDAIVAVGGNVGIDATTKNAARLARFVGLDVPVYRGSGTGLLDPFPPGAPHVHGRDGLGGCARDLPPAAARPVRSIAAIEGSVLATGPLTDVALALRLGQPVRSVVWMGGAVRAGGNATATAEFNAWADPAAADVVLTSGLPVAMVPLDVTHAVEVTPAARRRLSSGGPVAQLCDRLIGSRAADVALHDPVAAIAALEPDLFVWEERSVRCEVHGTHTRGMTVVDRRPGQSGSVRVAVGVDGPAVLERIVDAIVGLRSSS